MHQTEQMNCLRWGVGKSTTGGGGGGGSTTSTTQKSLSHISLFFTAGETFRGGSGKLFQDCKEYCLLELPSLNFFKRYPSVNVNFSLLDIKNRK